jgi:hypothetical protein
MPSSMDKNLPQWELDSRNPDKILGRPMRKPTSALKPTTKPIFGGKNPVLNTARIGTGIVGQDGRYVNKLYQTP